MKEHFLSEEMIRIQSARTRLPRLLNRHVRAEDNELSDRDFIKVVYERWLKDLGSVLIDPAE